MSHILQVQLLFFFFFLYFFGFGWLSEAVPTRESCNPKTCGDVDNIGFPFWVEGIQPFYCGFPDFKLKCNTTTNKTVLSLSGEDYYVQKILYDTQSVLLSNSRFFGVDSCAPPRPLNLTSSLFVFGSSDANLWLFANCSSSNLNRSSNIVCPGVFTDFPSNNHSELADECRDSVLAPVMPLGLDFVNDGSDYLKLLKGGFFLNWNASLCAAECVRSGGRCGYDAMYGTICLCEDWVHHTHLECDSTYQAVGSLCFISLTLNILVFSVLWFA